MSATRTAFLVILTLFLPEYARGQPSISGTVRDASGAAIPGVSVEAESPALIEKVRHGATDSLGQYRIVDLRPGSYILKFALTGFSTVKQQGIELTGSSTTTVNVSLVPGTAEETVTVTRGGSFVDVQGVNRQMTVTSDEIRAIPFAQSYGGLMVLIPAIVASSADSQVTPRMLGFGGSGGRQAEGRVEVDGLGTGFANGNGVSSYVADLQHAVEVSFSTSGSLGEAEVSGPAVNIVPRTGGNTFRGSFYVGGTGGGMIGTNYSEQLMAAGLKTPDSLLSLWDSNAGLGGPIRTDRLWFFVSARNQGSYRSVAGMYANLNAGDPGRFAYAPDETRPAQTAGSWLIGTVRFTAQLTPRNKINLYWDEQLACAGASWTASVDACRRQAEGGRFIAGGSQSAGIGASTTATSAPETSTYTGGGTPQRVQQITWQSPAKSRLLLEAGFGTFLTRSGGQEIPGNPTRDIVRVTEQCSTGCAANGGIASLVYRSNNWANNWLGRHAWRASASYVTGSQNLKVGYQGGYFVSDIQNFTNNQNLAFRFDNGTPNQLTELLWPFLGATRGRSEAVYAQDQWTHRRLSLQGALRFDRAWSWYPATRIGPTRFLPTAMEFAETSGVDAYTDISPRVGIVYDLFGDAKTSIKVNVGKYLEAASAGGTYAAARPTSRVATSVNRAWTDGNRNFTPDCDLTNPLLQDFRASGGDLCGRISDLSFGQPIYRDTIDPTLLSGWGVRPSDWSVGVSVQQEVLPRVSVEAGYFWRSLNGFTVIDNRAQAPSDFGTFSIVAPQDARLPNGGGYRIDGLYNANQNVVSTIDNFITSSDNYGMRYQHYNGVLVNVSMRPSNGLTFQGGVNTGRTVGDSCEIRATLPESAPLNPYCHMDSGFVMRATGLGSYTIQKFGVQIAGTFRSDPGVALVANYTVDGAVVAQSLGRPLSNNTPNVTVNLITPGSLYGDRVNDTSIRVAKILRFGRKRANVGLDINNIFNAAPILGYNESFVAGESGPWLTPSSLLQPRYLKVSAQIDF